MNKREFLDTLGKRLAQQLSRDKVEEHVRYYDQYLTEKIQQGMTEEEAVAALGDPLLIARTIMDTSGKESASETVYEEKARGGYGRSSVENFNDQEKEFQRLQNKGRIGCFVAALVIVVVLILVLRLVGSVLSLILPILIPILVILMVVEYFKKR